MSTVRNTIVLRNAALGALVVLALFECNGFVAARFGIKGVFCKENCSNTLRTSRVHGPRPCTRHVHGRLHGPTRPVRGRVHGPITAVHSRVLTHTCTPPLQGRVRAIYTAVYSASTQRRIHGPCTRPVHGSVNVRVHGSCTRPVAYMAGRPTGPCTRSQTARYGRVRPITAGRVHGPFTGHSQQCIRPCTTAVLHVHTSTPQLKGRVRAMYTSVYTASTQSCTWQVGLHGRDDTLRPWPVYTAVTRHVHGHVHIPYTPCTCSSTRAMYMVAYTDCMP